MTVGARIGPFCIALAACSTGARGVAGGAGGKSVQTASETGPASAGGTSIQTGSTTETSSVVTTSATTATGASLCDQLCTAVSMCPAPGMSFCTDCPQWLDPPCQSPGAAYVNCVIGDINRTTCSVQDCGPAYEAWIDCKLYGSTSSTGGSCKMDGDPCVSAAECCSNQCMGVCQVTGAGSSSASSSSSTSTNASATSTGG